MSSITTDKSRYAPGDAVTVTIKVADKTGSDVNGGAVSLYVMALQTAAGSPLSQPLTVANGASTTLTFHWTAPSTDYTGYLASAVATDASGKALDSINIGVDVSSSWARFPRYGYMTNNSFGNQSLSTSQAASIMNTMSNYHIDGLQFYDWQYNHDQPLCGTVSSPCASWIDDGNQKTVYASAVKNLVGAAHNANIVAMPYNAIFSADNGACCGAPDYHSQGLGVSPQWGVYQDTVHSKPLAFFQWDYMDPSNPGWQQYLMGQQNAAIQAFNFDGYHGDTFGDPDTVDYNYNGQPVGVTSNPCTTDTDGATSTTPVHNVAGSTTWLSGTFPSFLSYAKSALGSGKYLMFNPVTYDHAHCEANTSAVDLLYTELWPNDRDQYWDYNALKQAVDQGFSESASVSSNGRGKSLAVAAYVDFAEGGGGTFNTPDVLLLDSTLFASGGSHEELGDTGQMLDYQEYRAGATPMSASLSQSVQNYYDFMTAYENLLRDGQTATNQAVTIAGQTVSNQATPGDVWAFTKQDADHEIIQMINMVGQSSNLWQTGKCDMCSHTTSAHPAPTQLTDVPVKYYYRNTPKAVMFASPDYNNGTTYQVPFTTGTDSGGNYVSFTVPSLNYWDMVYTSQTGPGDAPMLPGSGPAPTAPGAPGTPAASAITATAATLSWTAAAPGTNSVAGYDVYRVGSPDAVVASTSGLSATVTGLSPSTAYQFYVKAKDSTGLTGTASGIASLTTASSGGSTPPGAPGTPTSSNVTASAVTLSWTAASAGTNAIAGYQVFEVGSPDTVVATTSPSTLSATVSGLTASTQYGFYVKAKDSAGTLGAASGTTTVTTASQPSGGAKVAYAVQSDWGSGFSASVTITNTGSTAINGWTLAFAFSGNQQVGGGWNANWSQSGHTVTATNQGFNGTIAPGASVQIGFTGTYSGANTAPTAFTVNGQPATIG
ncbi:glycoside hydrolase family 66 protein [Catenulispora yoronensis]|uniref:glycoside hydrolase family 66 protein n=1 Tax=Catenulispora yoronensis TaxID=450799 RepID=UPI0031D02742